MLNTSGDVLTISECATIEGLLLLYLIYPGIVPNDVVQTKEHPSLAVSQIQNGGPLLYMVQHQN